MTRPLFVPVILGTPRQGRMSEHAAKAVWSEVAKRPGVETELVDIAKLAIPVDDAGEAAKDPHFAELVNRADALILVVPEYNHGYPGLLKHVLDTNLKEYIHKAAGVVGVSAGVFGGARAIQNLIPVLRELGLVTIFWDVNFTTVRRRFDESGNLVDDSFLAIDKFLDELLWMAETLRYGRENVTIGEPELTRPAADVPEVRSRDEPPGRQARPAGHAGGGNDRRADAGRSSGARVCVPRLRLDRLAPRVGRALTRKRSDAPPRPAPLPPCAGGARAARRGRRARRRDGAARARSGGAPGACGRARIRRRVARGRGDAARRCSSRSSSRARWARGASRSSAGAQPAT